MVSITLGIPDISFLKFNTELISVSYGGVLGTLKMFFFKSFERFTHSFVQLSEYSPEKEMGNTMRSPARRNGGSPGLVTLQYHISLHIRVYIVLKVHVPVHIWSRKLMSYEIRLGI